MKKLLLLFMLMTTMFSYSQWKTFNYQDEFGEKTNETYEAFMADGTFSNSATQNSKCSYAFIKNKSSISIKVYEYDSSLATSTKHTFETVKIKTPNGDIVKINDVFFTKEGALFFNEKEFTLLNNTISKKGKYIMVFNRSSNYTESNYKVKFTIL